MIKRQLNPLRIGKGLLSLLALFMMLLAPQGAWAQAGYGLTVAGVTVTSENASAITGDEIRAGSVSFDATKNTLTLNAASLNGHIVWDNTTDLTIHLVGECSVFGEYPSSGNPVIKGNGGALLFTASETTPGSLYVGVTSVMSLFASGWSDSSTPIWTVDSQDNAIGYDWWAKQGCDYMTIAPNKKYDLKVNGTQYCDAWYKQQDHEAEYPNLIITDGNTLHISTKTDYAITSNMPALTVAVTGNASLSSIRFEATDQVTEGTLTITKDLESNNPMNSLSLKNTKDNLATISGFSAVNISETMTLKTPSETPTWDSYTGDVFVSDFVSYGITINDEIIGDKNAGNVLGDQNDTHMVSFDLSTNTLTLTNLDVYNPSSGEPFIKNGRGNLTIHLEGQSNFVWNNSVFIAKDGNAAEDYTVTFTTNSASPSNLTFRSSGDVFSTGHQVVYNNGLVLDISDLDNDYHTYDMTISSVEYDLTVAGVRVNSSNASDVLGDGKVSYDSKTNKLTLNGATIAPQEQEEAPGIDYTGTDHLTISFSGTNSITGASGCSAIRYNGESQTPPTLTFESSSASSTLTLTETSSSVIQYFSSVLGVNGINNATGNVLKLDSEVAVTYTQENGLHTVQDNETTPVTSANIVSVLKDPEFCFYVGETISNGETKPYVYGEEQTLPELKRWDNGSLKDPTGFTITYTSSDQSVAIIDNTGKITIVGVGLTEIRASIEATEEYAADEAWFTMKVVPAVPQVSIPDGAYFTGQKLSITTDAQGGDLYYSYGYEEDESKRTPYVGEISLPAGEYQFFPYVRCGTDNNPIWSYTEATELYVYDEPTISKDEGEYEGDIEVEITNLPHSDQVSVTAYYYLGDDDDDEKNDILYTAGDKITVRESTKLNVYLLVEGDSNKRYKTKVIERQYVIKDIPLDVTATDFHNHWMTYYHNENGNVGLPEDQNIGAYVATTISGNEIVVTQIKSIPRGEPVLLNDETTTTTTNVFGQDVQGNLLLHADEDLVVDEEQGDYYGLYNGAFMHVKGTIPAGKNYLMVSNAVVPSGYAPQLTIVIDGEATGVNDVRSKMEDVRGDIYDLQGRKVQKPSKKGLYINKGHKVVVK